MAISRCVLYVILAILLPAVSAVVRFTKQPVNAALNEGDTMASLSCTVAELDTGNMIVSFERGHHVISDGPLVRDEIVESLGLDPNKYRVTTINDADDGTNEYSLNINFPTRIDSGRFRCVVCLETTDPSTTTSGLCNANHKFATSDEVSLTVQYQPADRYPICAHPGRGAPATRAAPNDTSSLLLTEGQPAVFTCTSEIGSPPVRLDWTRNGAESAGGKVEVSDKGGLRESNLTITPTKKDNGTVLTCTLTSDVYNETERRCSLPPLSVTPKPTDDKGPGGPTSGTNIVIFIVLAVIVVLLIVAIVVALFVRRKKSQDSRGHKVEYQPAETREGGDELKIETHRDLQ